jgi:RNA 2',3'-cyclic 3'-phosphodiesterase
MAGRRYGEASLARSIQGGVMSRQMRTFVGLRVAPGLRPALGKLARELGVLEPALRSPDEADLHVTVQFLGPTPDDDVHRVARALREAVAGIAPIAVRYVGLGAFPEPARARVVWVGVEEEPGSVGALLRLAESVGARLEPLGYPPEHRRFHPHVTLGRLRRRPSQALVERIEAGQEAVFGAEVLSEASFILSGPGPRPYRYIDLTKVPLGGAADDA